MGWAGPGVGFSVVTPFVLFNAGDVGSILTWEYPACLLPKEKRK